MSTEQLAQALRNMLDITKDSEGVAGYRSDGKISEWRDFFEVDEGWDALAAHEAEKTQEVLPNGLTGAETAASASVLGLMLPKKAAPAAPVAVPLTDELVGKLLRTQSALSKMTKKYGEIGSRDVDVARWNTDLCEAIRAVGDVLADQPLEQLARIKLEGGQE